MTADLTPRMREILVLVADGLSDGEIAGRLNIARQTVGNQMRDAFARLGVNNRLNAARAAGYLSRTDPALCGFRAVCTLPPLHDGDHGPFPAETPRSALAAIPAVAPWRDEPDPRERTGAPSVLVERAG